MTINHKQFYWLGLLTVLLSGCTMAPTTYNSPPVEQRAPQHANNNTNAATNQASVTPQTETPAATAQAVPVPATPAEIPTKPQSPAVIALLNDAAQKQQLGDLPSAQVSLQRAQRIAPRDPQVYYELSKIHLQLKDYGLAEQVALKGVSIVQGNNQQLHRFWSLIAQIRTLAGNPAGAERAQKMADKY